MTNVVEAELSRSSEAKQKYMCVSDCMVFKIRVNR